MGDEEIHSYLAAGERRPARQRRNHGPSHLILTHDDVSAETRQTGYYTLTAPALLRLEPLSLSPFQLAELDRFGTACRTDPALSGTVQTLFDSILPRAVQERAGEQSLEALLERYGFDRVRHEQIRADLRGGRIGLAQNRLPVSSRIEDVEPDDVYDAAHGLPDALREIGLDALASGAVAVVSLAGGRGVAGRGGGLRLIPMARDFCVLPGKKCLSNCSTSRRKKSSTACTRR